MSLSVSVTPDRISFSDQDGEHVFPNTHVLSPVLRAALDTLRAIGGTEFEGSTEIVAILRDLIAASMQHGAHRDDFAETLAEACHLDQTFERGYEHGAAAAAGRAFEGYSPVGDAEATLYQDGYRKGYRAVTASSAPTPPGSPHTGSHGFYNVALRLSYGQVSL